MKISRILAPLALLASSALLVGSTHEASACAVFTPTETPSVVGHRMILSLSNTETTLWDQFDYSGTPDSFGWILPVKGVAQIGLSSDALFDALGKITAPQIFAPQQGCPNTCFGGDGGDGSGGGSNGGGVIVVAENTVGPFMTVQLSSQDPNALKTWLTTNGYPIPVDIGPILDAYVAEGFDFVALKLKPGAGIDSVKPVRVTIPGAAPSIPLRLLAAGTGNLTPVTLFVLGEGRWEPKNAPLAKIIQEDLVWDYKTATSNYDTIRTEKLAATNGLGWLVEEASPLETFLLDDSLQTLVSSTPNESGYGDGGAITPQAALDGDLKALHGALSNTPWIMRFTADLTRQAFSKDLMLGAAADQTQLDNTYFITTGVNAPPCPPDPCGGSGGSTSSSSSTGTGGNNATGESTDCSCQAAGLNTQHTAALLLSLSPLLLAMRRRRRA